MTSSVYIFHECLYGVKEFGATDMQDRTDVTFASKMETKKEFVDRLMTLPCMGNQSSRGWILENTSKYENYNSNIEEIVNDNSIYVFDRIDLFLGKFIGGDKITNSIPTQTYWIPNVDKSIKLIWNKEPDNQEHPSFGTIHISRVSSSESTSLFGSSIPHIHYITLTIHRATFKRESHRDWIFERGLPIVSVDLSMTQFANAMTSLNSESTPCTITFAEGKTMPRSPFFNKRIQFDDEFQATMDEIASDNNPHYNKIFNILSKQSIGKHDREEIINQLGLLKQQIASNMPFVKKQFTEQMDKTVLEAKNEFEAFIEGKLKQLGLDEFKKQLMQERSLMMLESKKDV